MIPFRRAFTLALVAASACLPALAQQAPFPGRPVTLVVPFPAGGPSDALARAVAQRMGTHLGQPVVVENVAGAGGTIGLSKVAKSPPDGYTLAFGTIGTHVANVALYKKLPYDPVADFQPLGLAGTAPLVLVARASLPAANLREFAGWLAKGAGKASYGSAGIGSISHFGCVMLLSALKQNVVHVPYRGVAPAMNDLMAGQVDFMCYQSTTAIAQAAGGKVKVIAVLGDRKLQQLPVVQTAAAAGLDLNLQAWNALFVPRATPEPAARRLEAALAAAVADPELRRQMEAVGVNLPNADTGGPAAVAELIAAGHKREVPALKARGEYLD